MGHAAHSGNGTRKLAGSPSVKAAEAALVALTAAAAAAGALHFLAGVAAWGAALAAGLIGAAAVHALARGRRDEGELRARRLLESIDTPGGAIGGRRGDTGPWADLAKRVGALVEEGRTASSAVAEVERLRHLIESASAAYREGKDPLTERPELRVSPLRELLEAARDAVAAGPLVSRLALDEADLVGSDGDGLPEPWPAGGARAAAARDLDELIRGLGELARAGAPSSAASATRGATADGMGSPAQLVDAVVQTAADGIEDLAAGLMRANELASVAERVTNRATLLALNAALEATRSGSEAFAAIAEETRRLAEFSREATDTISLLANEIEYKVGETITAIHATSDHAKSSLASTGVTPTGTAQPRAEELERLMALARAIRSRLPDAEGRDGGSGLPPAGETGADSAAIGFVHPEPGAVEPAPGGAFLLEGLEPGSAHRG